MVPRAPAEPRIAAGAALHFPCSEPARPWVLAAGAAGLGIELRPALPIPFVGLIGLILRVLVWMTLYRVASEVLVAAAEDHADFGRGAFAASDGLAARHIGLWLIATLFVVALLEQAGWILAAVGAAALVLVLPAATIVLTLTGSLIEALVPTGWVRLAARLGAADYARLCGVLLAAAAAYLLVSVGLGALGVGPLIRDPLVLATWAAGVLGWFHLAGRAVFLHRAELGLDDPPDTVPDTAPETFTRDPDALWTEIRERGGTRAMHAELARQLERGGDRERRLAHGRMHVEALLAAFEEPIEAVDRAHRMLSVDPDFVLGDPRATLALIRAAAEQDAGALTARLVDNYLAAFPNSSKRNEARLVGCEALQHAPTDAREPGRRWFRELMTAELDEAQRERLAALRRTYLGASADGSSSAG